MNKLYILCIVTVLLPDDGDIKSHVHRFTYVVNPRFLVISLVLLRKPMIFMILTKLATCLLRLLSMLLKNSLVYEKEY